MSRREAAMDAETFAGQKPAALQGWQQAFLTALEEPGTPLIGI
jgi:hypothetical protein